MRMRMPPISEGVVEGVVFIGGALLLLGVLMKLTGCDEGNNTHTVDQGPVTITVTSTNHITNLPPTQPTKFVVVPQLLPLRVNAKAEECPSLAPRN